MKVIGLAALVPALVLASEPASIQAFRLPNGLQVRLIENHERAVIRLELVTAWDSEDIPSGKEGLEGFLAKMLQRSSVGTLDQAGFLRSVEDEELRFQFGIGNQRLHWSVLAGSDHQDAAFEHMAMAAARSNFSDSLVEEERQLILRDLKARSPEQRALDAFQKGLGDRETELPTETTLARIDGADLREFQRRVIRPERSVLVLQGDLSLQQAKQLCVLHLGAWGPGAMKPLPAWSSAAAASRDTRTVILVEAERRPQVWIGIQRPSSASDELLWLLVGRWLVRECRATLTSDLLDLDISGSARGPWIFKATGAPGRSAMETLASAQGLLNRWRAHRWSPDELARELSALKSERTALALHPERLARDLAEGALGQPAPEIPLTLTCDEVQKASRGFLDPDRAHHLILGASAEDPARLEKVGLGPVKVFD